MTTQRKLWYALVALLFVILSTACGSSATSEPLAEPANPFVTDRPSDPNLKAATAGAAPQIPGMKPMLENNELRLYLNETTAEVAVLDKRTGNVWYSNPQGRQETSVSPYLQGRLSSQISMVYLTENGQNKDYDSYNDSVNYQQFDIEVTDTGVAVTFHFGNPERGVEALPVKLSAERFQELTDRLADEADKEELKRRYKFVTEQNVWEIRDIPKAVVKRVLALFYEKLGYTEEDLARDNEAAGLESAGGNANPKFSATIRYTLDGEHFVASLDASQLVEETPPYRIHSLKLLENFGAAGTEDQGYILIPDGSGSLIYLNNGNLNAQPINIQMYGSDQAIFVKEKITNFQPARLPVFGMKKNDSAFLAIIEEGDGLAWLNADIAGRQVPYNTVSANFVILPKDEIFLTENEITYKTPNHSYKGQLKIRYAFLAGEEASYSGMAKKYREYLQETYGLQKLQDGEDTPFYLEMTGSMPKDKNLLGIPYVGMVALSEIKDAAELTQQLAQQSIQNIRMSWKGWFNGGFDHDVPTKIRMDRVIGSKDDWLLLGEQLKQLGGAFYPDVAFAEVYDPSNGVRVSRDTVQYISRRYARIRDFDLAVFERRGLSHYLLSPRKMDWVVGEFLPDYAAFNPGAISIRDLGNHVYSDFARNRESTREGTKNIVMNQLQKITEQAPEMMVNGGNAYALPYADHVVNAPLASNQFNLVNESVPFYQMVLHGFLDYAGTPYNFADEQDVRRNVLRSLETGSNVYYSWITNDPSLLKDTEYSYLYANYYEHWFDEAVQAYHEVNAVLKQVRGQHIVKHERLAEGVYKTEYEQGLQIVVNYGEKSVTVDGVTVEAGGYVVKGGAQR